MHKQVSVQLTSNSKFLSKFSRKPLSGISDQKAPPPPQWKTSDLRWPNVTLKYPPKMKNFRFGMTKVYSEIPPPHEKLQIWDDQSLLRNTPPNEKLQIWDDQMLLRITPSKWKTSDLGWPKFTLKYPPPMKNFIFETLKYPPMKSFRFEMTKVNSKIPPPNEKLQIWDSSTLGISEIVCGD